MATTDPHETEIVPHPDRRSSHGTTSEGPSHGSSSGVPADGGHERSDVDVSRSHWVVIGSAVFLAVVMAAMWLMFRWMEGRLASADQPLPIVTERQAGQDRQPPEPRLLVDEPADLAGVREDEAAVLNSYGVVDRAQGSWRVPIDRAMTLLVERGVPTSPRAASAPPSNGAAGSPAPAIARTKGAAEQ
ncbi:MAG: hypothetical protein GEV06_08795 [Luteitalea sp.]|nr:hypothetical protein [Luteitalea sp.]